MARSTQTTTRTQQTSPLAALLLALLLALSALQPAMAEEAEPFLVKDIYPGTSISSSSPTNLMKVGDTLFFAATDGTNGQELWKSDGTTDGTVLVKDIYPGTNTNSSGPAYLTNLGGTLFFRATNSTNGTELWKSDGTTAGTVLVKDIYSGTSTNSSSPAYLTVVGNTFFFTANNGTNGIELWKSDGTADGTVLVKDIASGSSSSSPLYLTNVGGTLFFRATDSTNGQELWKSDGTADGTVLVKDITPGSTGTSLDNLTAVGSTLFFEAYSSSTGWELWKSDGTADGTVLVKEIYPGSGSSSPDNLTDVGGTLFFRANDGTNGVELWKSDGTADGTVLVKDIYSGTNNSSPNYLTAIGDTVFFNANDGTNGQELWKSDGTAGGTVLVKDISANSGNSSPNNLANVAGTLFFGAHDGTNGYELWKSDGTADGTVLLKDINTSTSSSPANLTDGGAYLFFSANNGTNGVELWALDLPYAVLSVASAAIAAPGGSLAVPILLDTDGTDIAGTGFSLDYDDCLSFDATDGDSDGLPDAVSGLPADFAVDVSHDATDTDGELDISIWDNTTPVTSTLSDGTLLTVEFDVKANCITTDGTTVDIAVGFSDSPAATYSDPDANDIPGTARGGTLTVDFNSAPVAVDDTLDPRATVLLGGVPTAIDVLANDSDADPTQTLSVGVLNQPAAGNVINGSSNVTFTAPNASGTVTFTYQATDGTAFSDEATVTVSYVRNDQRGDCNSSGSVTAADFIGTVLEIFDSGEDVLVASEPAWWRIHEGGFAGSPRGCDANASKNGNDDDTESVTAADLTCTLLVFFGNTACTQPVAAARSATVAALSAPQAQPAQPGSAVAVPLSLESGGNAIAAAAFSLRLDPALIHFDASDGDGDGVPDAVTVNAPPEMNRTVLWNAETSQLDIALYGVSLPVPLLSDGSVVVVNLAVAPDAPVGPVPLAFERVSLGDAGGQDVTVQAVDGSVTVVSGHTNHLFLPSVNR